jgi:hypothetical protein
MRSRPSRRLLAALLASALPVVVSGPAVLSVPLALLPVGLVVGAVRWALAHRWLPAEPAVLEKSLAVVRRDWALLHAGYAAVLVALFPVVAFVLALVIFQPF